MKREEFEKKWKRFIVEAPLEFMKDLNSLFLPPAELDHQLDHHLDHPADATAEEILKKQYFPDQEIFNKSGILKAMHEFAAQRQPQPTEKSAIAKTETDTGHLIDMPDLQPTAAKTQGCSCAMPSPDRDRECCLICGRLLHEDNTTAEGDIPNFIPVANSIYCTCSQRSLEKPISETAFECFDCGKEIKPKGAEEMRNDAIRIWYSRNPVHELNTDGRDMFDDTMVTCMIEFAALTADKSVEEKLRELTPSNEIINAAARVWARSHSETPEDYPEWIICDFEAGAYFVRQCYGCLNKTEVKP